MELKNVCFFGIVILENDHQYLGMNLGACHFYFSTSCIHYDAHSIHTFLSCIGFHCDAHHVLFALLLSYFSYSLWCSILGANMVK
jgi:hypothetical protein